MSRFVHVDVEPGPAAEDGISMRWKQVDELRVVSEVDYETIDGVAGRFSVRACDDAPGTATTAARAARVEDSSDGVVWLVVGGRHGLVLEHPSGVRVREPYLLLSRSSHVA
jgi:hypothetical protein